MVLCVCEYHANVLANGGEERGNRGEGVTLLKFFLRPSMIAITRAPAPALVWITIPPAKSRAPNLFKSGEKEYSHQQAAFQYKTGNWELVLFQPAIAPHPVGHRIEDENLP